LERRKKKPFNAPKLDTELWKRKKPLVVPMFGAEFWSIESQKLSTLPKLGNNLWRPTTFGSNCSKVEVWC
jgi:hypothetical protein